jgi:Activator of Hsp90 ATPase homolog 1-like protein
VNAVVPVERAVLVPLSLGDAFALFTTEMKLWWPFQGHSCSDAKGADVQFEPRVGGAVTEVAPDGAKYAWGTLSEWDPPNGFAMSWHPGLPLDQMTQLRVRFRVSGGGTEVAIHHSGWEARGDQAKIKRDQYDGGWPHTLMAFAREAFRSER